MGLLALIGCFVVGLVIWDTGKMVFFCMYWAAHDTCIVGRNLKPNLTKITIVKGLVHMYFFTVRNTFKQRINGEYRVK